MIYLHTGKPGAGKTLFTIQYVLELSKRENRQVYYFDIPDCAVEGWIKLEDAKAWYDLPVGAIVLIDECQQIFRLRPTGSAVPEHVSRLEKNRHSGIDLYLITQHPMLIDSHVRRLVNKHRNIVRAFGAEKATVYTWEGCKDTPERAYKDAIKTPFKYPKDVYSLYRSAQLHTYKKSVPLRVYLLYALPILFVALAYYAYSWFRNSSTPAEKPTATSAAVDRAKPMGQGGGSGASSVEYFQQYQPRLEGLPHTAPAYDRLTAPRRVPVPAACLASGDRCKCYTQDATPIAMTVSLCRQIVSDGVFIAFDPAGERRDRGMREDLRRADLANNDQVQARPYGGLPEGNDYNGFNHPGPVLSFDRGGAPAASSGEVVAGPVVQQAQGIGRGRVIQ